MEAFRLCPTPGCTVSVWGPTRTENHCKAHGGNPLGLPEIDDDEYGEPRHDATAGGTPSSLPAARVPGDE